MPLSVNANIMADEINGFMNGVQARATCSASSLHRPAVTDDQRLARERVGIETCRRTQRPRPQRPSTVVNWPSTVSFSITPLTTCSSLIPQRFRLLGNLPVDERRADEPRADHVGAHAVFGPFLRNDLSEAEEAVFGGHVGCLRPGRLPSSAPSPCRRRCRRWPACTCA